MKTFLTIILLSLQLNSQNLKDDGKPYFVPQRANFFIDHHMQNNFILNLSDSIPKINLINNNNYEHSLRWENLGVNVISNYNQEPLYINSVNNIYNPKLEVFDRYYIETIYLDEYEIEKSEFEESRRQYSEIKINETNNRGYNVFSDANPQRNISIPLVGCEFYNFYSTYGDIYKRISDVISIYPFNSFRLTNDTIFYVKDINNKITYKDYELDDKYLKKGNLKNLSNNSISINSMLTSVQHLNNNDFWLIYHKVSNDYFSLHFIDRDGKIGIEKKSTIGIDYSKPYRNNDKSNLEHGLTYSYLKPSPNGKVLAQTQLFGETIDKNTLKFIEWHSILDRNFEKRNFLLFKFDNEKGIISDEIIMNRTAHSMEFSPNSRYLYITSIDGMYVYDLIEWDRDKIIASEKRFEDFGVWSTIHMGPHGRLWGFNYMNDTILCIRKPNEFENIIIEKISVLDLPSSNQNDNITLSNLLKNQDWLPLMPNMLHHYPINDYYGSLEFSFIGDSSYCVGEKLDLDVEIENYNDDMENYWVKPNGMKIYEKNLVIDNVTAIDSGWYKFNLESPCDGSIINDSIFIKVPILEPNITSTKSEFCQGDSATLSLDKEYELILWNTGENTKDIIVKDEGIYSATVTEGECTNDTSIEIKVNQLPEIDILAPNGTILCDGGSIDIEVVVENGIGLLWNDGSRIKKRTFNESGTYSVTAKDINTDCEVEKEIVISDIGNTKAEVLGNNEICTNESTTLTITPQAQSYFWNTGENTQSIVVNQGGIYSATITTEAGCELSDDIEVIEYPNPEFEIKGEKIICNNTTELYVEESFESYLWSTGETERFIIVDEPGNYSVTITDINGCRAENEVEVKEASPELNLSTNNINFGEILFGQNRVQTITADKAIIKTQDTKYYDATINNKQITFSFNPNDIGEYLDTLVVESIGDCKAIDTIYIKGICKAEILSKVSDSEGYPGDLIQNNIELELKQQIPLPKDFEYSLKIAINQDAIIITDNTIFNYASGMLVIDINEYLTKNQHLTDVKEFTSKLMLASNHNNPIEIVNFTTDNPYLIPLRQDGMIKIYEVCVDESRLIEYYDPAEILKLNKTILTLYTKEEGAYSIEITDINGKSIYKKIENEKGLINFNYQLSNGSYLIKINEPGKTQTLKVIFME